MAFHANNAFIVAQFPVKLPVTDINCKNFLCAVHQHTIRKSAGRCPYVNADAVFKRNLISIDSFLQFQPAAADKRNRILFQ